MAVKISSLGQLKKLPTLFLPKALLSSLSCAMSIESSRDSDQFHSDSFETKILDSEKALKPENPVSYSEKTPDSSSSVKIFNWASLQKRFKHTAEAYKVIISKLGMAGQVTEMEAFCSEMARENYDDTDKSLLELIQFFVHNKRFNEALRVLYVMINTGLNPSVEVFNALMAAIVEERRDLKEALFVYKEMVKAGTLPNMHTLNYLIDALFDSGRIDAALDQYKRLEKKGCSPNSTTFRILIARLAETNRVQQCVSILEEMFKCECELDSSFYTCLIPIFCSFGYLEIVMKLFDTMKASNTTPNYVIYAAMIKCLCDHLQVNDAILLLKEMTDSGLIPDYIVYFDVVTGLRKISRLNEAQSLLKGRISMDISLHNAILSAHCDTGNLSTVEDKFNSMFESNIIDTLSWNIIIRFLCERLEIDKASKYICRMIIYSFCPDSSTFSGFILAYSRLGNIVRASALYRYIKAKLWVLDHDPYGEFINGLCRNGRVFEAFEVFHYMSDKGCVLDVYSLGILFEKICRIREAIKAIEFLPLVRNIDSFSIFAAYNGILRGLCESGQENYLNVILCRMIALGYGIEIATQRSLVVWMSSRGKGTESAFIFNSITIHDSETLSCLLPCLSKYSKVHLILPCVHKLTSRAGVLDRSMYNVLIYGLWKEGYKTEANELLDKMLDKGFVPEVSLHSLITDSATKTNVNRRIDNISRILEEGLQSS